MKQTTNSILMIRPVAFRMNEQTAVNNYYQKVLDNLNPAGGIVDNAGGSGRHANKTKKGKK